MLLKLCNLFEHCYIYNYNLYALVGQNLKTHADERKKQKSIQACFGTSGRWLTASKEYADRMNAILQMIISTGCPMTMIENESFRSMISVLDPKFRLPSAPTVVKQLKERYDGGVSCLKSLLRNADRLTICLDGWSKRGLTRSYLGISACFYDSTAGKPVHIMLNLTELPHPHTGTELSVAVDKCLREWNIDKSMILMTVTDNGSNMIKAIKILKERAENEAQKTGDETEDNNDDAADHSINSNSQDDFADDTDTEDNEWNAADDDSDYVADDDEENENESLDADGQSGTKNAATIASTNSDSFYLDELPDYVFSKNALHGTYFTVSDKKNLWRRI